MPKITEEQIQKLRAPLPAEAISPHPSKSYLSTINPAYVIDRLNEVFGPGAWRTTCTEIKEKEVKKTSGVSIMVVVKLKLEVPDNGISYEQYGGNDNDDLGDAYKGATTDALTKIASYLGIGLDVWKEKPGKKKASSTSVQQTPQDTPGSTPPTALRPCPSCKGGYMEMTQEGVKDGRHWRKYVCMACKTVKFYNPK